MLDILADLKKHFNLESDAGSVAMLFESYAFYDKAEEVWRVPLHGWVFEKESDSAWKNRFVTEIQDRLKLDPQSEAAKILKRRLRYMLVDNEQENIVTVTLGANEYTMPKPDLFGHFSTEIKLSIEDAEVLKDDSAWLKAGFFGAALRGTGKVMWAEPNGVSIISDIDDTIKITAVTDRKEMLRNSFAREFKPVPGMAEVYAVWEKQGALFHYVSASPWQLYLEMVTFLKDAGFPLGAFNFRRFRLKDRSFLQFVSGSRDYKIDRIRKILKALPNRKFILVGDSGEKDPEIYGQIFKEHASQIQALAIRMVDGGENTIARFSKAFESVPREKWKAFREPSDLLEIEYPKV